MAMHWRFSSRRTVPSFAAEEPPRMISLSGFAAT
jgi:hypothetical protein